MRAVTGSVTSSRPISLSKAAAILSRFAVVETGVRRDVAAYLKRTSAAFDDLVQFHRELRADRKKLEVDFKEEESEEKRRRKKKKKTSDGNSIASEDRRNPTGVVEDVNLTDLERDFEGKNEKVKNKKEIKLEEGERVDFEGEKKRNLVVEEERPDERTTKEKKKKKKREREEFENGWVSEEEKKFKDGKRRKHLSVEEVAGELEDQGGQRHEMKKKKRRKSD